jgi:hypothetical protein
VILSSSSPSAHASVGLRGATAIELDLTRIENPAGQPIAVRIVLDVRADGRLQSYDLGMAAPFPTSQTGVFLLSFPDEAKTLLRSPTATSDVALTLVPIRAEESLKEGTTIVGRIHAVR